MSVSSGVWKGLLKACLILAGLVILGLIAAAIVEVTP